MLVWFCVNFDFKQFYRVEFLKVLDSIFDRKWREFNKIFQSGGAAIQNFSAPNKLQTEWRRNSKSITTSTTGDKFMKCERFLLCDYWDAGTQSTNKKFN